ncbi:hypothetical protein [Phenylobacterium sp. J367]|uniref:hypothetical protein n=1 Tax=Phenylobacterium sp. J367 TaxID=2898435 RepID=UPI002150B11A|nr:hypothetical protein [Phenylobacterium sp. J367]MCR5880802.1 hypothetical protein [Phenylobacterium sp. J367]
MSVYTLRRQISGELDRALSDQFVIATAPDHPLLMKGPDFLIGGLGNLTALLIPTAMERRRPDTAVARFALCRMALPEPAKFILLAGHEDQKVADVLTGTVAAVLSSENVGRRAELASLVAEPQRLEQKPVPEGLRQKANARFGEIYRVARVVRRWGNRPAPTALRLDWPPPDGQPSRRLKRTADVAALTIKGAHDSYEVDAGVPHPTDKAPEAAVLDMLRDYPGDPQKYLRASAFSGWVLSEAGNPHLGDGMRMLERLVRP